MTLCNSLAAVAHCLCVDDVDSAELMDFVAYWLIPLDKNQVFDLLQLVMFLGE